MRICTFKRGLLSIAVALSTLAGCGGDFCASSVSSVAGTWEIVFDAGGSDTASAVVTIDDDGNVTVAAGGEDDWDCALVHDELCDLEVHCEEIDGNDAFSFTLKRK